MNDIQQRVQHGIAVLDEWRPGWESQIDLETLNIGNFRCCVLGQVYGRYSIGLAKLGIPDDEEGDYGFDGMREEGPSLTAAWKAAIEQRQKEVTPAKSK